MAAVIIEESYGISVLISEAIFANSRKIEKCR